MDLTAQNKPILLWPEGTPNSLGDQDHDKPTITPYLVSGAKQSDKKSAVVIFPGGGYGGLASHEGHDYALWFNQKGIQAFVVKYRLGSKGYRHPSMLNDASRAVRFVRTHAEKFNVHPSRIGVIGSSAGGHLSSTILTHFESGDQAKYEVDRVSSRPDFGILCYPVISMGEFTHRGSKRNLLGPDPSEELVELLSNEKQVNQNTPPCFIWHTAEDKAVKVENALLFAASLAKHGVPFDIHVYQKGRHGIGLQDKYPFKNAHPWSVDLEFWLKENDWL